MNELDAHIKKWVDDIADNDSESAFQSLYLQYFQPLLRFASIYLHSVSDAEEIVSDTFLNIWENRKSLKNIANINAHIYTVTRNKAISKYRATHMQTQDLDENKISLFVDTDTSPEEKMISREMINKINAAIESLPDKCKEVFKLVREDNLKYKEVAEILGISAKTVENHMALAVKKLREILP